MKTIICKHDILITEYQENTGCVQSEPLLNLVNALCQSFITVRRAEDIAEQLHNPTGPHLINLVGTVLYQNKLSALPTFQDKDHTIFKDMKCFALKHQQKYQQVSQHNNSLSLVT